MAPKRELIATKPISEFGELDRTLEEEMGPGGMDFTYVPGWSDLKHQRDVQLAQYAEGTLAGSDVKALPGNVRWVRCRMANGNEDGIKMMAARNNGYRALTKEDIGKAYLTGMPPGSRCLPDGTIVNSAGDCQLMFAEPQYAARNLKNKTDRWLAQSGNALQQDRSGGEIAEAKFREIKGADNQSIAESAKPSDGKSMKRGT